MLHTKIIDIKKNKILISEAEKFIQNSKFGASIYFLGTVRNTNNNKEVIGFLIVTNKIHVSIFDAIICDFLERFTDLRTT